MFKIKDGHVFDLETPEGWNYLVLQKIDRQSKEWWKYTESWSAGSSFSTVQFSR